MARRVPRSDPTDEKSYLPLIQLSNASSNSTNIKKNIQLRTKTTTTLRGGQTCQADIPSKSSKPKLGRASSSVARIQSSNASSNSSNIKKEIQPCTTAITTPAALEDKPPKKPSFIEIYDNEGNESDKENWAPRTQGSVTVVIIRTLPPPAPEYFVRMSFSPRSLLF